MTTEDTKTRSFFDIPRKDGWTGYLKTDIKVVYDRFKVSIPEVGKSVIILDTKTNSILWLSNIHPDLIIHVIHEVRDLNQCLKILKKKFGKAKHPFTPEELKTMEKQEIKLHGKPLDDDWYETHRYAIS